MALFCRFVKMPENDVKNQNQEFAHQIATFHKLTKPLQNHMI